MADVAVIMGSLSDWETMKQAAHILETFGIDFDKKVISSITELRRIMTLMTRPVK